jgi:hypothetical protein
MSSFKAKGQKGGKKVSSMYGKAWKEERASKGGNACLMRYGRNFYQAIRAKRKTW